MTENIEINCFGCLVTHINNILQIQSLPFYQERSTISKFSLYRNIFGLKRPHRILLNDLIHGVLETSDYLQLILIEHSRE